MKRTSDAARRNAGPLAAALASILPASGTVLELGSGTGEHAVHLARVFPSLAFQPSDPDPEARASVAAWSLEARLPNLRPPLDYDLRVETWQRRGADAILCVNVLHVAPPECLEALCRGAARILAPGGPLAVAGPFSSGAEPLAGRLARLDAALRAVDPALGVRRVEAVRQAARRHGLQLEREVPLAEQGDLLLVLRASA